MPRDSELMGLRPVRKHNPDLPLAVARGFKNNVTAVGRPTGPLVAALVAGQLDDLTRGGLHHVNVVVPAGPPPTERQDLSVGRPSRVDQVALVRKVELDVVRAVRVHHIELGDASAVTDVYDALSRLGVPARGGARASGE